MTLVIETEKFSKTKVRTVIAFWTFDGLLYADTTNWFAPPYKVPNWTTAADNLEVLGFLDTAPAGASVILDVQKASTLTGTKTSLYATGTPNYPEIAAGDRATDAGGSSDTGTLTTTSLDGEYLFPFVRQVGSTLNSEGRTLRIVITADVYLD